MKVKLYDQRGRETGELNLSPRVFGLAWRPQLVKEVLEAERAGQRQGRAHAKGRGEVRGGGRKPWRQKGTGRARAGSIRSPLWRGGGVTHGPQRERVWAKKINKQARRQALLAAFSQKLREGEIIFLDSLELPEAKTKKGSEVLKNLARLPGFQELASRKTLALLPKSDPLTIRALRNLPRLDILEARNSNLSSLLSHKFLVLPKESVKVLEATFLK